MYTFVKTHEMTQLRAIHFTVFKFYIKKIKIKQSLKIKK